MMSCCAFGSPWRRERHLIGGLPRGSRGLGNLAAAVYVAPGVPAGGGEAATEEVVHAVLSVLPSGSTELNLLSLGTRTGQLELELLRALARAGKRVHSLLCVGAWAPKAHIDFLVTQTGGLCHLTYVSDYGAALYATRGCPVDLVVAVDCRPEQGDLYRSLRPSTPVVTALPAPPRTGVAGDPDLFSGMWR